MQRFHTAYTVWFNRRHNRSGHLFEGRYGASVVAEDAYILKLSRYVHLNPVYVSANDDKPLRERIRILRAYAWSSYRGYAGLGQRVGFVTHEPILAMMAKRRKNAASVYRDFVEAGIRDIDAAFLGAKSRSRFCIGSDDHHDQVAAKYEQMAEGYTHQEDISFQEIATDYSEDAVLEAVSEVFGVDRAELLVRRHDSWLRPLSSRALQVYAGLSQRQIAQALSIGSGAAVSKQLRLLDAALLKEKRVRSWWDEISKCIERGD